MPCERTVAKNNFFLLSVSKNGKFDNEGNVISNNFCISAYKIHSEYPTDLAHIETPSRVNIITSLNILRSKLAHTSIECQFTAHIFIDTHVYVINMELPLHLRDVLNPVQVA